MPVSGYWMPDKKLNDYVKFLLYKERLVVRLDNFDHFQKLRADF